MNFITVTRYTYIIAGNTRINLLESRQIHLDGQQSEFVVTRLWRQINNGATVFVLVSLRETLIKFHILSCLYCSFLRNFTLFKCMPWANFMRCSRRCLFACHLCFKHVLVFLLNNWSLCSQMKLPWGYVRKHWLEGIASPPTSRFGKSLVLQFLQYLTNYNLSLTSFSNAVIIHVITWYNMKSVKQQGKTHLLQ